MIVKNFYSVIIGTELLNGRRSDAHFEFINGELQKRGWEHKGSFIIADDVELMEATYKLIRDDKNSVMFSFGGIGATPDDHTREIASKVFRDGKMAIQEEAKALIVERFKERAFPNRINMAFLPIGAKLLKNPINRVPGFYLDERFFFVPGFPEMAQAMVVEALDSFFSKNIKKFRKGLYIEQSEESLIEFMKTLPKELELSSLPIMKRIDDSSYTPAVSISLASYEESLVEEHYGKLIKVVETNCWKYELE